jgi:hypothetical protein
VEVRDADITNFSIAVKPGATLNVEVVTTSTNNSLGLAALSLGLRVLDSMPRNFASTPRRQFDSVGRLRLDNIPEARYGLSLSGLPESAYVSDVRQDGKSIFDDGFLLQESSNPIQIFVSQDGGTVSGRIRWQGPTADVTVVLVPPVARRRNAALFKSVSTDEDGAFIIRGVAPGPYTVIPLETRPAGEPWLNTDFMAKYEGRGQAIQVRAGSVLQVDFTNR